MGAAQPQSIRVIDSHTGGEPTRVVVSGGPDLGAGDMAARLQVLRDRHDWLRSSVVNEPRGSEVLIGALLCAVQRPESAAGVIFFNNAGYLGMCGHGTIGLAVTLAHLGRLQTGEQQLDTPVGTVSLTLHDRNKVSFSNVPSYRHRSGVRLQVAGIGEVHGDIAWGGNWFFLVAGHGQALEYGNIRRLSDYAWAIRRELEAQGIRGADGAVIDHIELFGEPSDAATADSRNFVLCPGRAYDRSPCGTGTSAKIACLIEDGKLAPGDTWRQESITGSIFEARASIRDGRIIPQITGTAWVTADATLLFDPADPHRHGLGAAT